MARPLYPGGTASLVDDGSEPADIVTVREVAWHHLAAVALRESLAAELLYSGWSASLPGQTPARRGGVVAYTGVAFTPEGLPVGHAALRWSDDDVELQQVYVTPSYRGSGTAAALLAAAEDAARALDARRILLRPDDQQPGEARFWEQAGYKSVGSIPPLAAHCLEKVITGIPRKIHHERAAAGQAGR
jgi:GNAT superfamily N-acetyltransferase